MGRKRLYQQRGPISQYKSKVIENMARNEDLVTMIRNVSKQNLLGYNEQDLLQDCYLYLLDLPDDKLRHLMETGEMRWYMASLVCRQYNSSVSPFYNRYRKFSMSSAELPSDDDDLDERDAIRFNLMEEDEYGKS